MKYALLPCNYALLPCNYRIVKNRIKFRLDDKNCYTILAAFYQIELNCLNLPSIKGATKSIWFMILNDALE